eukprot:763020-Hanusia_phi.AAC.14
MAKHARRASGSRQAQTASYRDAAACLKATPECWAEPRFEQLVLPPGQASTSPQGCGRWSAG